MTSRRQLLTLALLCCVALVGRTAEGEAASPTATTTSAQTAALAALDHALAKFDALLARDDNAAHRAETQPVLAELKQRRDALHAAFDQGKYDELRVDLNLAYQRMAAWMKPPTTRPSDEARAHAFQFSVFQLDPDPADSAAVSAALAALDREIARQEERAPSTPEGATRDAALRRVAAARQINAELKAQFSQERWSEALRALR